MAEEGTGQVEGQAPATGEAPAAEQAAEAPSWVNSDGTLKDGWQKSDLIPEEFKGRTVYNAFTDVKGMLKQIGHQDKTISRQGKGLFPPTEAVSYTHLTLPTN